jgi:uncharacterized protein YecE (DUF72 family)
VKAAPELRIGTSGWNYGDWQGRFYPPEVRSKSYLEWYARHFNTVEVNYSFYHLPRPTTYVNWAGQVAPDFVFAVKASRFITHIKRLSETEEEWRRFLESAWTLEEKLGPVLLQFPPSLKINTELLASFLQASRELTRSRRVKLAFEFRHKTWFEPEVYEILHKYHAVLVIAQSDRYPQGPPLSTGPFMYLRFHGPGRLFASSYSEEQLKGWRDPIRSWLSEGRSVYVYFNNDFQGYAIENAKLLRTLIEG